MGGRSHFIFKYVHSCGFQFSEISHVAYLRQTHQYFWKKKTHQKYDIFTRFLLHNNTRTTRITITDLRMNVMKYPLNLLRFCKKEIQSL